MHISLHIETVYKDLEDIHTRTALKKTFYKIFEAICMIQPISRK